MKPIYFHHPRCSKSREALSLLQEAGIDLEIREYLKHPPTAQELREVCDKLGVSPSMVVRRKEEVFSKLRLSEKKLSDDEWCQVISEHPVLLERPILVTAKKAAIGRPPENVLRIIKPNS